MSELTGNYHQDCNILITANKKLEAERDALQAKIINVEWLLSTASAELANTPLFDELVEILEGEV